VNISTGQFIIFWCDKLLYPTASEKLIILMQPFDMSPWLSEVSRSCCTRATV